MVSPQRTPGNACRDQSETEGLETCAARRGRGPGFMYSSHLHKIPYLNYPTYRNSADG